MCGRSKALPGDIIAALVDVHKQAGSAGKSIRTSRGTASLAGHFSNLTQQPPALTKARCAGRRIRKAMDGWARRGTSWRQTRSLKATRCATPHAERPSSQTPQNLPRPYTRSDPNLPKLLCLHLLLYLHFLLRLLRAPRLPLALRPARQCRKPAPRGPVNPLVEVRAALLRQLCTPCTQPSQQPHSQG